MKIKPATLLSLAILVAGLTAVILLIPGTLDARNRLSAELSATPTPTADVRSMLLVTPDPNATPTPTPLLLKVGTQSEEVRRLQQRLKELGYLSGEADGQFGSATEAAVIAFQRQHGLTADGIAGDETRAALYSQSAQTFVPTPSPSPSPTPAASLLKKGSSGDAVRQLQSRLSELGYYSGEVDGAFGGGTEEAVRLFQRQNGLDVDGSAGVQTFAALYDENARKVTITPTPDPNTLPMLVNREHPVDESYQPDDLVKLSNVIPSSLAAVKGSDIQGDRAAVNALIDLFEAAHQDGVTDWQISAGYRSYSYQQQLFDRKVQDYLDEGFSRSSAISATRQTVADPGTSEHHTGLAFDITVPGTIFKGTPEQIWLHEHCWDFGFIIRYQEDKEDITGYLAECWHIRYVGLPHSTDMRDRNLCLEEYLGVD